MSNVESSVEHVPDEKAEEPEGAGVAAPESESPAVEVEASQEDVPGLVEALKAAVAALGGATAKESADNPAMGESGEEASDGEDGVAHWRKMSRKHEDRAKASAKTIEEMSLRLARAEFALANGISVEDASLLLTGASDEDRARAEKLMALAKSSTKSPVAVKSEGNNPRSADNAVVDVVRDLFARS